MATAIGEYTGQRSDSRSVVTIDSVRNILNETICISIRTIVADSQHRMHEYMNNYERLRSGTFYPYEYFIALRAKKQTNRMEYLLQRDAFYNGYLNPRYFKRVKDSTSPSGRKPMCFVLRKGADPVEALQSVRTHLSLLGCGEVCQVVHYEAILAVIGPEKFRELISSDSTTPLMLGSQLDNNPIGRLRSYILRENPPLRVIRKGDLVYVKNVPFYTSRGQDLALTVFALTIPHKILRTQD